jgi:hypothetical protein
LITSLLDSPANNRDAQSAHNVIATPLYLAANEPDGEEHPAQVLTALMRKPSCESA